MGLLFLLKGEVRPSAEKAGFDKLSLLGCGENHE